MEDVRKEIEIFLEKMTCPGTVAVHETGDEVLRVAIETQDARFLIGAGGEMIGHLDALIKKVIQKKNPESRKFFIDVNDYRQKKAELLKEDARNFAKLVRLYRKEKVLDPMPSYERRVIHSVLSEYPDILTESVGVEPERRIVIKPAPQPAQ